MKHYKTNFEHIIDNIEEQANGALVSTVSTSKLLTSNYRFKGTEYPRIINMEVRRQNGTNLLVGVNLSSEGGLDIPKIYISVKYAQKEIEGESCIYIESVITQLEKISSKRDYKFPPTSIHLAIFKANIENYFTKYSHDWDWYYMSGANTYSYRNGLQ